MAPNWPRSGQFKTERRDTWQVRRKARLESEDQDQGGAGRKERRVMGVREDGDERERKEKAWSPCPSSITLERALQVLMNLEVRWATLWDFAAGVLGRPCYIRT